MHSPSFRLIAASALALTMTFGSPSSSIAQRTKGDEGTGGAAGYSPPVETGPAAEAPAARSMTAPPPPDAGQAAPAPDAAPPPEDGKPEDGIKPPADYQPD